MMVETVVSIINYSFYPTFSGSNGLGTLLTVTGSGFSNENASIMVGKSKCHVEQVTSK